MKFCHTPLTITMISVSLSLLAGCAASTQANLPMEPVLEEMEAFALCQTTEQGNIVENKVRAEYGFKRMTEGAYRPVIERELFGHKVHVVELNDEGNKIYASGEPAEFAYNFKQLLPEITCIEDTCQAPLTNGQSVLIYKAKLKKSKDTTVIECTKPIDDTLD